MNAEKGVPIFGSKWEVEVHMFGVNFAVRVVYRSAPQEESTDIWWPTLGSGLHPKLQNKEHTIYGSLRAVANTQAKNSDSESIPNSRP